MVGVGEGFRERERLSQADSLLSGSPRWHSIL